MLVSCPRAVLALLVMCCAPAPLAAQADAHTADWRQLTDRADSAALRPLTTAPPGAVPAALIRAGLAAVRLYELTRARTDHRTARDLLGAAREAAPREPWAHLGYALALARGPQALAPADTGLLDRLVTGRALRRAAGLDDLAMARRAAVEALRLDPALPVGGEVLAELGLRSRDSATLVAARTALEAAVAARRADATSLAALARVLTTLGEPAAAARAGARGAALGGTGAGEARYARALALLDQPDSAAAGYAAWRRWVAAADSAALVRAWLALEPAAEPWDVERWRGGGTAARRTLLLDFWKERAALSGVREAERAAEHYRRLRTAHDRYPRRTRFGAPPGNALLLRDRQELPERLDDRGTLYVRHGQPDTIVRTFAGMGEYENESWAYRRPEGGWDLFNFFRYPSSNDYVLIHRVPCDGRWLAERAAFAPALGGLAGACTARGVLNASAELRDLALAALEGDSHRPPFTRPLPLAWDVATFRGTAGATDVVAALALPLATLAGTPPAVRASVILVDTVFGTVTRLDTLATAPPGAVAGSHMRLHLGLAAPPAAGAVQRLVVHDVAEPGHGAMVGGPLELRDYTGDTLMVSDLLLVEPDEEGPLVRGQARLALVPGQRFVPRTGVSAFRVFYEIYNLREGTPFETRIEIERLGQGVRHTLRGLFGGNRPVELRFTGVAAPEADGAVRELRRVEMELEPSLYRLRVTVSDPVRGSLLVRERRFTVLAPPG
ncbi:MAG: hypothetical protein WEA24_18355 [Gemmatimonadota bacterium]